MSVGGFEDGRGPGTNKCGQLLKAKKGKGVDFPLEPPEGTPSCCHLNFNSVILTFDFWPLEGKIKMCVFLSHRDGGICYRSNRKWVQVALWPQAWVPASNRPKSQFPTHQFLQTLVPHPQMRITIVFSP